MKLQRRQKNPEIEKQALNAGFDDIQARLVSSRGITTENLSAHLRPTLQSLDSPDSLADIDAAARRIVSAIESDEVIAIETDHDVDGVTSHAVIYDALTRLMEVSPRRICSFIGHRLNEGYGLSESLAQRILASEPRPSLVITADNGSADEPRIKMLHDQGIDTVVTDHHEIPENGIPQSAVAVVNPTREDSEYPDTMIAGCMVSWLLMVKVMKRLNLSTKPAVELLDFVALGTVADCVSIGQSVNNRCVILKGLGRINDQTRPCWGVAVNSLAAHAQVISELDLGFGLGPRINARGRLDDAMAGVHFLLSTNLSEAFQWWEQLEQENESRKAIEHDLKEQAFEIASQQIKAGACGLAIWLESGHPGVHGIVASRVVERFGHPTVCLSPVHGKEQTHVTGSARQIPGFHVSKAFEWINHQSPDLFDKFGGHEGAGGLTFARDKLEPFQRLWDQAVQHQSQIQHIDFGPVLWSDGEFQQPTLDAAFSLKNALSPFGRDFPSPVFEGVFRIRDYKWVGDLSHCALTLDDGENVYRAIFFSVAPELIPLIDVDTKRRFAYELSINTFRSKRSLQLMIRHIEPERAELAPYEPEPMCG